MSEDTREKRVVGIPFGPGNPGRPKGARSKFSEDFLRDFHELWKAHGVKSLERVIEDKPEQFLQAAVKILPRIVETETNLNDGDRDRLERVLEAIDRGLAVREGAVRAEASDAQERKQAH